VVSDNHAGLKAAIREILPEAAWQRCHVHLLPNTLDYVPRKADDAACKSCAGFTAAAIGPKHAAIWQTGLARWAGKHSRLTAWVEENLEETLSFYRLPRHHHKHLKSTNMLERLNEEIDAAPRWCGSFGRPSATPRVAEVLAIAAEGAAARRRAASTRCIRGKGESPYF
jgi:putative transposase